MNSGSVNVSSADSAGQIVMLGENMTSSGALHADASSSNGGDIELHDLAVTGFSSFGSFCPVARSNILII